eukprot:c5859_g1_i1.p1 GENE.c5859_g1_i1~~c5859_g1_i1.p1  ORF type:complete len:722 (-),score=183.86 c5859_g1_i1:74-2239(-)
MAEDSSTAVAPPQFSSIFDRLFGRAAADAPKKPKTFISITANTFSNADVPTANSIKSPHFSSPNIPLATPTPDVASLEEKLRDIIGEVNEQPRTRSLHQQQRVQQQYQQQHPTAAHSIQTATAAATASTAAFAEATRNGGPPFPRSGTGSSNSSTAMTRQRTNPTTATSLGVPRKEGEASAANGVLLTNSGKSKTPRSAEVLGVKREQQTPVVAVNLWAPRTVSEIVPPVEEVPVKREMSATDLLKLTKPDSAGRREHLQQKNFRTASVNDAVVQLSNGDPNFRPRSDEFPNSFMTQSSELPRLPAPNLVSIMDVEETGVDEDLLEHREIEINIKRLIGSEIEKLDAAVYHGVRMQRHVAPNAPVETFYLIRPIPNKPLVEMNIRDLYSLRHVLGEGAFAKVHMAVHRLTEVKVAMKVFEKSRLEKKIHRQRVDVELSNHGRMVHRNIARMFEVMESSRRIYMILEFAPRGDLHKYVRKKRRLTDLEANRFFADICKAVLYLHESLCIAHRDIKLENCLLAMDKSVKLVDMGFSVDASVDQTVACGSPSYTAPEICARKIYDAKKADIWSMGVLLYAMICGYFPFQGQTNQELQMRIQKGSYRVPDYMTSGVSDLLSRMLVVDPVKRADIVEVIAHPWLAGIIPPLHLLRRENNQTPIVEKSVVNVMRAIGFNADFVTSAVQSNSHNHVTTTYHFLCLKKQLLELQAADPELSVIDDPENE